MPDIPSSQRKRRREILAQKLVELDYNWVKAGLEAGYSRRYCETGLRTHCMADKHFCKVLDERIQEKKAQTQDDREKQLQRMRKIRDDDTVAARDQVAAGKLIAGMCGWLSQTMVLETPQRQRELDQAALEVARRAALAVYDTKALPPALPVVEATVKQVESPAKPGG